MNNFWSNYVSYTIWRETSPAIGQEYLHCDRKRGYSRARKKEPAINPLAVMDNVFQRIGHLAQQVIYEFQQNTKLLSQSDGKEQIAKILQLNRELPEVQTRIQQVINNYYNKPFLLERNILELSRGDEDYPPAKIIRYGDAQFKLYAAFDCVVKEPDNSIHIIDFKTGKSGKEYDFDSRQAYVYLVVAKELYPQQKAIASFYNLENQIESEPISLSETAIESVQMELFLVAQKLKKDLNRYKKNPDLFDRIYPANPGSACKNCNFNSICEYATT